MSKRKYESFTEEQAKKVLRKCGGNHRSKDPKDELDKLVRDPPDMWRFDQLYWLFRGIGGLTGYNIHCMSDMIHTIREGYHETPPDEPFDRERCIEVVRKISPCCDDVIDLILQYYLPIQHAPGTILTTRHECVLFPKDLVVTHYTRMGKCCATDLDGNRRFDDLTPCGNGVRYWGDHYAPRK